MDAEGVPVWYVFNQSVMCSPEQPERLYIKTVDMHHMIAYVPERKAKRISVPRHSHVALGHYECGLCRATVGPQDRYCRRCGAGLLDRLEDES